MLCHANELLRAAAEIGVKARTTEKDVAEKYISFVLNKYRPWKTSGHLSIGENVSKLPTDENEFLFFCLLNRVRAGCFLSKASGIKILLWWLMMCETYRD